MLRMFFLLYLKDKLLNNLQHAIEVMNDSTASEALIMRDINSVSVSISDRAEKDIFTISTGHSTTIGLNEFDVYTKPKNSAFFKERLGSFALLTPRLYNFERQYLLRFGTTELK